MVGWAETGKKDPNCVPPQQLEYQGCRLRAKQRRESTHCSRFPGDVVAAAIGINDNGDVVGLSGTCGPHTYALGVHTVVWRNGSVFGLGGLGGAQ